MATDTSLKPLLVELAACLCAEVEDSAQMCFCGVIVGQGIPAGFVSECAGVAYVRLVTSYPSSSFPTPDATTTCLNVLAYQIAVGVIRPAVPMDESGDVDTELVKALSLTILDDVASIRKAIRCCFGNKFEEVDYVLGEYQPIELDGIAGGEWTVAVQEPF